MKNLPQISNFDLGVFGKEDGQIASYRRVVVNGTEVQALAPSDPPTEGEQYGVYLWNDDKGQWVWVADHSEASGALAEAQALAGTTETFTA